MAKIVLLKNKINILNMTFCRIPCISLKRNWNLMNFPIKFKFIYFYLIILFIKTRLERLFNMSFDSTLKEVRLKTHGIPSGNPDNYLSLGNSYKPMEIHNHGAK